MNAPLYTVEILRLAASLPEPVELERVDGAAEARSPTCGSVVRTEVALGADGRVEALSQQVHACAFGQASAALVAAQRDRAAAATRSSEALAGLTAWLERRRGAARLARASRRLRPARSRKPRHARDPAAVPGAARGDRRRR